MQVGDQQRAARRPEQRAFAQPDVIVASARKANHVPALPCPCAALYGATAAASTRANQTLEGDSRTQGTHLFAIRRQSSTPRAGPHRTAAQTSALNSLMPTS